MKRVIDGALRGRGSIPPSAGTLLFEEGGRPGGGALLWDAAVAEVVRCFSSRACAVDQLVIVNLDTPQAELGAVLTAVPRQVAVVTLDFRRDPEDWLRDVQSGSAVRRDAVGLRSPDGVAERVLSTFGDRSALLVDCLTTMLVRHGLSSVLRLLTDLRRHPNCASLVVRYRTGGRRPAEIEAVESLFAGVLVTAPPREAPRPFSPLKPHGAVRCRQTTESGRVACETEWYRVNGGGRVSLFPEPEEASLNAAALALGSERGPPRGSGARDDVPVEDARAAAKAGAARLPTKRMEGGMKLGLTNRERAAKNEVVLPYEKAAGLGEIHYARDSEEDCDSDEDPDDDLDI